MHQCPISKEESRSTGENNAGSDKVIGDGFQTVKIASLENRTNTIEHCLTILTSKFENMQFNYLAANKS